MVNLDLLDKLRFIIYKLMDPDPNFTYSKVKKISKCINELYNILLID